VRGTPKTRIFWKKPTAIGRRFMPHKPEKYLCDMLDHGVLIQSYVAGKTVEDFLNTNWLQDAVHWNLSVIGEALSQLRKIDEATATKLTGHSKIIGLRNQLIHGYSSINTDITWEILEKHLPVLIGELRTLLGE
jgi:uncharacterized protein with HEPN domain